MEAAINKKDKEAGLILGVRMKDQALEKKTRSSEVENFNTIKIVIHLYPQPFSN